MQTAVNSSDPPETNKQYIYIYIYLYVYQSYINNKYISIIHKKGPGSCSESFCAAPESCILNLSFFFTSSFLSLCCRRGRRDRWARLPDHNTYVQPAFTPRVTATRVIRTPGDVWATSWTHSDLSKLLETSKMSLTSPSIRAWVLGYSSGGLDSTCNWVRHFLAEISAHRLGQFYVIYQGDHVNVVIGCIDVPELALELIYLFRQQVVNLNNLKPEHRFRREMFSFVHVLKRKTLKNARGPQVRRSGRAPRYKAH